MTSAPSAAGKQKNTHLPVYSHSKILVLSACSRLKIAIEGMSGAHMRYFVIGAVALVVVVAGVAVLPDLVRYIKISSM
jgi:hypothetical protein